MEYPKKGRVSTRGIINNFVFILKTDYMQLKTSYKDEGVCL